MPSSPLRRTSLVLLLLLVVLPLWAAAPTGAISTDVVISQVYGGGGNSGAVYTNDYVELFNRGTTAVDLSGWSIQYASATGTGNFGANTGQLTPLSGTVQPGRYVLVQEAAGSTPVAALPTPDVTDATPINMSGTGGKVALVNSTTTLGCNGSSTPCSPSQLAQIVDLVGWDGANFYEGTGPAPATANPTALLRKGGGCVETDSNANDFVAATPAPRNSASPANVCTSDAAPAVSSMTPTGTGVAVDANVSVTFSEPVNVSGTWFTISCATSGSHTASVSGGPTTFVLDPDTDFAAGETCTVTIVGSQVTDQDTDDPPDVMAANATWSFWTLGPPTPIHDIQGASHTSPLEGQVLANVPGIVTAASTTGFWMEDPTPDSNDATSEGIFVYTKSKPVAAVGDAVRVAGTVQEFRPGGASSSNLTTTELSSVTVSVLSSGSALPAPVVIGTGGRIPPSEVMENDATGDVETSGVFDPAEDGLDFWESLEGMRVQLNDAVAVGPTATAYGETPVVSDDEANAGVRTARGGLLYRYDDPNPERLIADDLLVSLPDVNVGDHYSGPLVGVLDYNFGNYFLEVTDPVTRVDGGLQREITAAPWPVDLTVATFNFENLAATDPQSKFDTLASLIVTNLRAPDLIAGEEVQDDNGTTDNGTVAAGATLARLVAAIQAAGGPAYAWREVDPVNDEDGGAPGGNIRQVFLFRTDRGLSFVDAPGGDATTATGTSGAGAATHLTFSPGRIEPTSNAWADSRKPLAGEFLYRGQKLFVIANHFNSKGGDEPLAGRFQPPERSSETQRHEQAHEVADFVSALQAADPGARIVVLGDLNDFEFSETASILEDSGLHDLMTTLPPSERYSYVYEGNSEALDHILVSGSLAARSPVFDPVHVNAEFFDQASDHDPSVVRLPLPTFSTLCELVRSVVTSTDVASSLCDKLVAAAGADARGNAPAKAGQLAAFRLQVDAQTGKAVPAGTAARLKEFSTWL